MAKKQCSRCQRQKEPSDFGPDKRASDGLQSACRECSSKKNKERRDANIEEFRKRESAYYSKNKDRINKNRSVWRAENKSKVASQKRKYYERVKNQQWFQEKQRAYRASRKEDKRQYDKQYAKLNSDKKTRVAKDWIKSNPIRRRAIVFSYDSRRRAAMRGGPSSSEIRDWARKQTKVCYWCGEKCLKYHIDHYIPIAKGGEHSLHNLVISCPPCNHRKNAKSPYEYAKEHGRLF